MIRFRIAGVPVRIQPLFFALAALLGIAGGFEPAFLATWIAVVLTGVLAHELGHAAAFRAFGCDCAIELHGFGGHTFSRNAGGLATWQDVAVSVAGPAVGIVIGGAAELWLETARNLGPTAQVMLSQVSFVNLAWGVLNLLPILPMDGGRVLAAVLMRLAPGSGERAAHGISTALAALGLVASLRYGMLWPALLCGLFAWSNFQQMRVLGTMGPDRPLFGELRRGFAAVSAGDAARGTELARAVLARARRDATRLEARRLIAWAQLHSPDPAGALQTLDEHPELREREPLLHGLALRAAGRPGEAIAPLRRALDSERSAAAGAALVAALVEAGDRDGAEALVHSPQAAALDDPTLARLEELMLADRRPAVALLAAERRFQRGRSGAAALAAARASAALGDPEGAVAWLRRALEAGLEDPARALAAPELAALGGRPDFETLRRRLG